MSLLNDGLRRLQELRRARSSHGHSIFRLQPVDYGAGRPSIGRWILMTSVVIALVFSGVMFYRWFRGVEPVAPAAEPVAAVGQGPSPTTAVAEPDEPKPSTGPLAWHQIRVNTNVQYRSNFTSLTPPAPSPVTPGTNAETTAEPAPALAADGHPALRLQSIIYHEQKPAALINGEMLGVGDTIQNCRITEIRRNQVILEWQATNLILALPRL